MNTIAMIIGYVILIGAPCGAAGVLVWDFWRAYTSEGYRTEILRPWLKPMWPYIVFGLDKVTGRIGGKKR